MSSDVATEGTRRLPLWLRIADWLIQNVSKVVWRTLIRTRVLHAYRVPQQGAALLVANHPSYLEPFLLTCLCVLKARRPVAFMAWDKLFTLPFISQVLRIYQAFPVNLERPGSEPYKRLLEQLESGGLAGIFPEGERSSQPTAGPFKPGALRACQSTGALLLPVTILGAYEVWPQPRKFPRLFGRVRLIVHRPRTLEELAPRAEGENVKQWLARCEDALRDLLNRPIERRLRARARLEARLYAKATPASERWRGAGPISQIT